jgi:hypothetical protein
MSENIILQVSVELDDEFFDYLICDMFEGGSNYWIDKVSIDHPDGKKPNGVPMSEWASGALNKGGSLTILPQEWDDGACTINKANIVTGLKMWVANYPDSVTFCREHGKNCIDAGNIDANESDRILQYAIFGELVFG